jgi:hypothetical protein
MFELIRNSKRNEDQGGTKAGKASGTNESCAESTRRPV